jgi:hypothetical protein
MGLLENKMTPAEINQAKLDSGGYHAAAPTIPSVPSAPSTAQIRVLPPPASPQPPPAAAAPAKKDDIGGMLDNVPEGLRKRFGF